MTAPAKATRRRFLKTSLLCGAGLAVAPGFAANPAAKPIRVAVIGTGGRGTSLTDFLLRFRQVAIPAVCDVVRERANAAAKLVENKLGRAPEVYADSENAWERLLTRDDLDAVIIATPPDSHAVMAVGAMRAGKLPGVEVPAAMTLRECHDLVSTSRRTGIPCMMLENVCYFRNVMAVLRMAREGLFGELLHAEAGYQHDCRQLAFTPDGKLTWRGRLLGDYNGNRYPTHAVGPVAQWLDINRGDRFVSLTSVSTAAKGLKEYAIARFGPDHPLAKRDYQQGDINTTMLTTARGRTVTLYYNITTHRPYDLTLRLQGVNGIYYGSRDSISLAGSGGKEEWEPFGPYQEKYEHPLWKQMGEEALASGGHGGAELLMFHDFLESVRNRTPAPQDVHDAATWSAIVPLSLESVSKGGQKIDFPDFTNGAWKSRTQ